MLPLSDVARPRCVDASGTCGATPYAAFGYAPLGAPCPAAGYAPLSAPCPAGGYAPLGAPCAAAVIAAGIEPVPTYETGRTPGGAFEGILLWICGPESDTPRVSKPCA